MHPAAAVRDMHWRLPERACLAVGGTAAQARPTRWGRGRNAAGWGVGANRFRPTGPAPGN